jgi:hypothetical protein
MLQSNQLTFNLPINAQDEVQLKGGGEALVDRMDGW